jgi:hypothetical protein
LNVIRGLLLLIPSVYAVAAEMPPNLMSVFTADRYKVTSTSASGFRAWNAANQLGLRFLDAVTEVTVQDQKSRLLLVGLGWGGRIKPPGPVTQLTAAGTRVNRIYASGLREWFNNSTQGLEQNIVVERRRGAGALTLRFEFTRENGKLDYSAMQAWDAKGTAVAAHISGQEPEVVLEIGDGETPYPLTVGPLMLRRTDVNPDDAAGISVALSGDEKTAVIGQLQPRAVGGGYDGAVYIYALSGGAWAQQAELRSTDWAPGDGFGASVALADEGSVALVGAPDKTIATNRWQGAAYVFVRSGTAWRQEQALTSADGVENDVFGYAVALADDGRTALVGAAYKTIGVQTQQGAAYVFARNKLAWAQQAELRAYDGATNAQFGAAVSLSSDGSTAMVGTGKTAVGKTRTATTYAFVRREASWSPRPERIAGASGDRPMTLVAAPYKTILAATPPGAVCLPASTQVATTLAFATQPSGGLAGVALSPAVVVQVQDASGNLVNGSTAAVTVTSTPSGVSAITNAVGGIATFANLSFNSAGTYKLTATSGGLTSATSQAFTINLANAARLAFTVQPLNGAAGTTLAPVVVQVQDASGNPVATSAPVTLNSIPAGLTTTVTAVNGVATFSGLTLSAPGTYSFAASASGLASATSNSFTYLMMSTKAAVFRNNLAFLADSNGNGRYDAGIDRYITSFTGPGGFLPGDIPVVGDWTGDGHAKVGIYRGGTWFLDANNNGVYDAGDYTYVYGGLAGDLPFVGDWSGLGKSCIAIYRPNGGSFWLLDLNCNGSFENTPTDAFFPFGGLPGDVPVVGAWTGGTTRVGVVRKYAPGGVPQGNPFFWVMDGGAPNAGNQPVNHPAAANSFAFGGLNGDVYITGDWYGTGTTGAGMYRNGLWVLDALPPTSPQTIHVPGLAFAYGGLAGDIPVPGKW